MARRVVVQENNPITSIEVKIHPKGFRFTILIVSVRKQPFPGVI